ncbi:MAG: IS1634 family transposase, partial [Microcystis sp.]|uniref:IS1634 family transposase n=1 Tax=Microcystis sp. TaxID=1127 RepID=UPI003919C75A
MSFRLRRERSKLKSKDDLPSQSYQVQAELELNLSAIERLKKRAGRFVLATNKLAKQRLSSEDILKKYKGQQAPERAFSFLISKTPAFLPTVSFSNLPTESRSWPCSRCSCLLVYTIGQRQLRLNLKQQETGLKNQLGKSTDRPTLRWIFQNFQGIHL